MVYGFDENKEKVEVPDRVEYDTTAQTVAILDSKAFNYFNNTQYIPDIPAPVNRTFEVDTSKHGHLMMITTTRLDLLILNKTTFPVDGYGFNKTPLVGTDYTIMSYAWEGDVLKLNFDRNDLSAFCYMLTT